MRIAEYVVTLRHDAGGARIRTTASSFEAAREKVCKAEGCPPSAILGVVETRVVYDAEDPETFCESTGPMA